ncbi:hypothetical protein [Salinibacter altiplanensis]|uniref:hypothetical protein n=1 Tax=Salinibacter altiplanensis TaxID=1803181 RepID=UPI001E43955D|nr:hypothetical protein [Salinibacter altiplanensis]
MSAPRSVLLLGALFLSVTPGYAQSPVSDSVTLSAESVRALQTTLSDARGMLDTRTRPAASGKTPSARSGMDRSRVVNVLFLVLALSLVFESAMSVLFDWRLFIRYCEGRGVKTPFIIAVAFLVFLNYDLDIVAELLRGFPEIRAQNIGSPTLPGQILTALLIAGGSGGVFRIFARLGIRSPEERDRKARKERASMKESSEESSPDTDS